MNGNERRCCNKGFTFEGHHEVVEGVLILFVRLSVVLGHILLDRLLDDLDGALRQSEGYVSGYVRGRLLEGECIRRESLDWPSRHQGRCWGQGMGDGEERGWV